MDASSALGCDSIQFQMIYQDLLQFGDVNHERIVIHTYGQHSFPATAKKEYWGFSALDEKVSSFVLAFLENNLNSLALQPQASTLFVKFDHLFQGEHKLYFNLLHQKFFRLNAQVEAQSELTRRHQEAEKKLRDLEQRRLQEIKKSANEIESKRMLEISTRSQIAEETLKEKEALIKSLENQLATLKKGYNEFEDSYLDCKDGTLYTHLKLLEKAAYFKVFKQQYVRHLSKSPESYLEKPNCIFHISLKNFQVKIVDIFIKWLDTPEIIKQISSFDDLLEIYQLAEHLKEASFSISCIVQLLKQMSHDNALKILSKAEFPPENQLIQCSINWVRCHFKLLKDHPQFMEIRRQYFIPLLKSYQLHIDNEVHVFKALIAWAQMHAKKNNLPLKELLHKSEEGHCLIDCIRLGNFTKQQFVKEVIPLGIISPEEENSWLSHFLKEEGNPQGRFHAFRCLKKGEAKAKIVWNIPIEIIHALQVGSQRPYTVEFSFQNQPWLFIVGKYEDGITFSLVVKDYQVDFDYFLEINKIRVFSHPSNQPEFHCFNHLDEMENLKIKAVKYSFDTLENNIDSLHKSLPLRIKLFLK